MDPPYLREEPLQKALVEQQPPETVFCGLKQQFCNLWWLWYLNKILLEPHTSRSLPGLSGWIETAPFALFILIVMAIKNKKDS